jgi:SAM-dependent methyltransferase
LARSRHQLVGFCGPLDKKKASFGHSEMSIVKRAFGFRGLSEVVQISATDLLSVEKEGNDMIQAERIQSKKLDVGCGRHRLPDAIGIDQFAMEGVDFVHDVSIAPWPFESNRFSLTRCQHAIEHFRDVHTVAREMWRVSENGARLNFITPHYSSSASWGDPTHLHHFALPSIPILFEQAVGVGKYIIISNRLKFTGSVIDIFGWIIYRLSARKYEKHFAWIFPANEIHTIVQVVKS